MSQLINFYRQVEDYFFRGISSKCLDLDDGAHAYMTVGAELNFIYITRNTNTLDKILTQGKQFFDNAIYYPQKSKSVSMVVDLGTVSK